MGVQGLWQLIQSTGRPVTLESLEGKILAVDVSIWLHKTMKGMRGADGNALPNAHLLGIFKRVCKLLFYKIKPVFVFDGTAPALKKQTLASRRNKARKAELDSHKTSTKILTNYLKSQLIRKTLGKEVANRTHPVVTGKTDDMYALPEGVTITTEGDEDVSDDLDDWDVQNETKNSYQSQMSQHTSKAVDPDSHHFRAMPSEVQHEILVDMKERRKHASWYSDEALPEDSEDFSRYQLAKMMKQSQLTIRIDEIRKEMNLKHLSQVTEAENFEGELETQRLMSEDSGHYVLLKGKTKGDRTDDRPVDCEGKSNDVRVSTWSSAGVKKCQGNSASELPRNTRIESTDTEFIEVEFEPKAKSSLKNQTITSKLQDSASSKRVAEMRKITEKFFKDKTVKEKAELSSDSEDETADVGSRGNPKSATEGSTMPVKSRVVTLGSDDGGRGEKTVVASTLPNTETRLAEDIQSRNISSITSDTVTVTSPKSESKQLPEGAAPPTLFKVRSDVSRTDILNQLKDKIHKLKTDLSSEESETTMTENAESGETLKSFGASEGGTSAGPSGVLQTKLTKSQSDSDSDGFVEIEENAGFELSSDDEFVAEVSPPKVATNEPSTSGVRTQEKVVSEFHGMSEEQLEAMADNLEEEGQQLEYERNKQDRVAATLSEQIHLEAQELLRLFGVPFIVSPTEAEAQCAYLDLSNQCDGSVTDDSDIWLFGGKRVYRNFFNQDRHVELFRYEDLEGQLSLDRDKLINLALLCGSDYTDGIQGVGAVSAMEIMAEFPAKGTESLRKFRVWWDAAAKTKDYRPGNKIKAKLRKLELKSSFPSDAVIDAYKCPTVDESEERFTWTKPDLDRLRNYAMRKFGWSRDKCDEQLLPVIKKLEEMKAQRSLTSYFSYIPDEPREVGSKRLQQALDKVRGLDTMTRPVQNLGGLPEHCGFPVSCTSKERGENSSTRGRSRGRRTNRGKGKTQLTSEGKSGTDPSMTSSDGLDEPPEARTASNIVKEDNVETKTETKVQSAEVKSLKRVLESPSKSSSAPKRTKTVEKFEVIEGALTKAKAALQPHMNNRRRGRGRGAPRARGVPSALRGRAPAVRVVKDDVDLSESSSSSDTDTEGQGHSKAETVEDKERRSLWNDYVDTYS